MGLANRIVPTGASRHAAEALAQEIASMPQMCMRADRMSTYEQFDLSFADAMRNELRHGLRALQGEGVEGATRFAEGAGRHGGKVE